MEKVTNRVAEKMKITLIPKKRETPEPNQAIEKVPISEVTPTNLKVTFDDRMKLVNKIKDLPSSRLKTFIVLIEKIKTKGIEKISKDKLQIKVDDIDKKTFTTLTEFLDKKVSEPPKKIKKH